MGRPWALEDSWCGSARGQLQGEGCGWSWVSVRVMAGDHVEQDCRCTVWVGVSGRAVGVGAGGWPHRFQGCPSLRLGMCLWVLILLGSVFPWPGVTGTLAESQVLNAKGCVGKVFSGGCVLRCQGKWLVSQGVRLSCGISTPPYITKGTSDAAPLQSSPLSPAVAGVLPLPPFPSILQEGAARGLGAKMTPLSGARRQQWVTG